MMKKLMEQVTAFQCKEGAINEKKLQELDIEEGAEDTKSEN